MSKKDKEASKMYREALNSVQLSEDEIDEMRRHMRRLAEIICDQVWNNRFR